MLPTPLPLVEPGERQSMAGTVVAIIIRTGRDSGTCDRGHGQKINTDYKKNNNNNNG